MKPDPDAICLPSGETATLHTVSLCPCKCPEQAARREVPDAHRLVDGAGDGELAVGRDGNGLGRGVVTLHRAYLRARPKAPQRDPAVVGGGHDAASVWGERHVVHAVAVHVDDALPQSAGEVPDGECVVAGRRDQQPAVGCHGERVYIPLCPSRTRSSWPVSTFQTRIVWSGGRVISEIFASPLPRDDEPSVRRGDDRTHAVSVPAQCLPKRPVRRWQRLRQRA